MNVENNHAIALVLVLIGSPLASENSEYLLYQLETSEVSVLVGKSNWLVKP